MQEKQALLDELIALEEHSATQALDMQKLIELEDELLSVHEKHEQARNVSAAYDLSYICPYLLIIFVWCSQEQQELLKMMKILQEESSNKSSKNEKKLVKIEARMTEVQERYATVVHDSASK